MVGLDIFRSLFQAIAQLSPFQGGLPFLMPFKLATYQPHLEIECYRLFQKHPLVPPANHEPLPLA